MKMPTSTLGNFILRGIRGNIWIFHNFRKMVVESILSAKITAVKKQFWQQGISLYFDFTETTKDKI